MGTSRSILYLHCGVHRTGTTVLQHYFSENRKLLRRHGIKYPFVHVGLNHRNHRHIVDAIKHGKMTGDEFAARLENARGDDSTRLLLSCEDFASIESPDWLARLHETFEVRILFYLRRQDLWWDSWYNQNIKWAWSKKIYKLSPREFLARIDDYFWIDYHSLLTRWAGIVGRENLLLGVVGRHQIEDVLPDALEKIGLDPEHAAGWDAPLNESVPPLALEILRHIDVYRFEQPLRPQIIEAVVRATEARQTCASRMVYRPSERREIMKRFEESNARVAREFFGREDGRLFLDADIRDDDPYTNSALPDSRVLLEVIAPVFGELIAQKTGNAPG